jgi:sortase A
MHFDHEKEQAAASRPKRGRNIWLWPERLLLASGLALLAFYAAARIESFLGSRAALQKFAAIESPATTAAQSAVGDAGSSQDADSLEVDFILWDAHRLQAYQASLARQSGVPSAVLRISKIHLEVPVFDGTDELTLNHAVGRIAGTARPGEPGNIGIAGHRDGFFRGLKDVRVGDAIELETPAATDTYLVERIRVVAPEDVSVLQPRSVPSLTLVTCYPFYFFGSAPERYIVTASLSREIKSGSENSTPSPLSQTSSTTRRNNEQPE